MARVVSQRSGPPYLLIVFVFLFVVSTAIAVLVYLELDEVRKARAELEADISKLAGEQLETTELKRMMKQAGPRKSVFAQQQGRIRELIELVTGDRTQELAGAKAKAQDAFKRTGSNIGLAEQVIALKDQLDGQKEETKKQGERVEEVKKQRDSERKKFAALDKDFKVRWQRLFARVTAIDANFTATQKDHEKDLAELAKQSAEKIDGLNKRIAELTGDMEKLQLKLREKDVTIGIFRDRIVVLEGGDRGPEFAFRKPAGKIAKVLDENDLCYIGIGRRDRVKPGLTFSVYPAMRFGDETSRKGSILVTSVLERVSVCRITDTTKGNPIVPGDLIENVAFDPTKTFLFVVEGDFDLSGKQRATPEGAEEVKALIRRYGGKTMDAIGPQTDFVALGQAPVRPARPSEDEDEPAQVEHVRKEQQRIWQRYQDVKRLAREKRIPVLNQNRFIALTGYHAGDAR